MAEGQQLLFTNEGNVSTVAQRVAALDPGRLPHSYSSNSTKEELALEYVENFRRQFISLFPDRQPLLLFPKNECGVRKFVCTTVRPTQLQYRELYNLEACADFVAKFLDFEPLQEPLRIPGMLPSPSFILQQQIGDSFGFANVLTSMLIGYGYDAYFVYGYAPKWVCMRDLTDINLPESIKRRLHRLRSEGAGNNAGKGGRGGRGGSSAASSASTEEKEANPYNIKHRGVSASKFIEKQIESKKQEAEARRLAEIKEGDPDDNEGREPVDESKTDEFYGKRLHAWVMIAPVKRDVEDYLFVEATTGEVYSAANSPYLGIEALWNNRNYWVNMQDDSMPLNDQSFDLTNTENWEYVFVDPLLLNGGAETSKEGDGEDVEEEEPEDPLDGEQILDLPPSWVSKLAIERDRYRIRYGTTGSRVMLYRRAKVEIFAENVQEMGLVFRVTTYKDLARSIPVKVEEHFRNRRDKLYCRERRPLERETRELFAPGRQSGLAQLINVPGRQRCMRFYLNARLDGLSERVESIGRGIVEHYEGRDDCLRFREVVVDRSLRGRQGYNTYLLPCGELGELTITKMVEKYDRNVSVPASVDNAKRVFFITDGRAFYNFHYHESRITAATAEYYKDESKTNNYSSKYENSTDPGAMKDEIAEVWLAEKRCYNSIRNSERENVEILQRRRIEEGRVVLDRSVFETAHARAQKAAAGRKEAEEAEVKQQDPNHVEYLTPFLQDLPDPNNITRDQAKTARTACLQALKERLLERADIIQKRLDDENAKLAKKQAAFQRSRDHVDGADEEFEQFCSKAMFTIQILEQRLGQHEVSALKKYADMDAKLRNDPRLAILK